MLSKDNVDVILQVTYFLDVTTDNLNLSDYFILVKMLFNPDWGKTQDRIPSIEINKTENVWFM